MCDINVTEITHRADWKKAISSAEVYDCYHSWDFHAVSRSNDEGTPILFNLSNKNSGILIPLLARKIPNSDYRDLTSVYGYPSPVTYGDISNNKIASIWSCFIDYLKDRGYVSLFSRLHPILTPEEIIRLSSRYCGKIVVIDLTLDEEDQLAQYREIHRRNIRKLKKIGVECNYSKDEAVLQSFILNYESRMRALKASNSYLFPLSYYKQLLEAPDFDARIYSCRYNGKTICSGIFIFCGDIVQYHLGGTDQDFYKLSPTKLMFDKVRADACRERRKYFVLGGGVGCERDNLFKFKAGFSERTEDFNVIEAILNQSVYDALSFGKNTTDFFPRYRAK